MGLQLGLRCYPLDSIGLGSTHALHCWRIEKLWLGRPGEEWRQRSKGIDPRKNDDPSLSNTVWSPMTAAMAEAPTTNPPTAMSEPRCLEWPGSLEFD